MTRVSEEKNLEEFKWETFLKRTIWKVLKASLWKSLLKNKTVDTHNLKTIIIYFLLETRRFEQRLFSIFRISGVESFIIHFNILLLFTLLFLL